MRLILNGQAPQGAEGLQDRSSRPRRLHRPTPQAIVERIEVLRRQRMPGKQIAAEVGVSPATVSRILKRLGLNRLAALEATEPVRRFDRVGHRITGDRSGQSRRCGVVWEFVHVCIDDASRIAFSQILPDERKESAVAFLKAAIACYASLGVSVTRVMTDNGSCYKSRTFRDACRELGLRPIRPGPARQRPMARPSASSRPHCANGPCAIAYPASHVRAAELPRWLHRYDWHRPHGSLNSKPQISRLALARGKLLRLHSQIVSAFHGIAETIYRFVCTQCPAAKCFHLAWNCSGR